MWGEHWRVLQDHVKYIHNDIVKPLQFGVLHYAERAQEMHNLVKYLPPPLMKGQEYHKEDWAFRDKYLSDNEIRVATKDGIS